MRTAAGNGFENAFLILLADWQESKWRFFVQIADKG